MPGVHGNTTNLQLLIDRTLSGDGAYDELIDRAYPRLRRLARLKLKKYPLRNRWGETDDVLQLAMLRLHRSLREVRPQSVQHFFVSPIPKSVAR